MHIAIHKNIHSRLALLQNKQTKKLSALSYALLMIASFSSCVKKEFDTETRNSIGQEYLDLRSEFEVGQVPMKPNKQKKPSEIRAH